MATSLLVRCTFLLCQTISKLASAGVLFMTFPSQGLAVQTTTLRLDLTLCLVRTTPGDLPSLGCHPHPRQLPHPHPFTLGNIFKTIEFRASLRIQHIYTTRISNFHHPATCPILRNDCHSAYPTKTEYQPRRSRILMRPKQSWERGQRIRSHQSQRCRLHLPRRHHHRHCRQPPHRLKSHYRQCLTYHLSTPYQSI